MKVASLVLGILGLCFSWIPLVGIVMSVLAITFGGIKRKSGMGTAGLILGLIGLIIGSIITIIMFRRFW